MRRWFLQKEEVQAKHLLMGFLSANSKIKSKTQALSSTSISLKASERTLSPWIAMTDFKSTFWLVLKLPIIIYFFLFSCMTKLFFLYFVFFPVRTATVSYLYILLAHPFRKLKYQKSSWWCIVHSLNSLPSIWFFFLPNKLSSFSVRLTVCFLFQFVIKSFFSPVSFFPKNCFLCLYSLILL